MSLKLRKSVVAIAIFGDHRQHLVNGRRPERLADVMSSNYTHELVLHFTPGARQ